MRFLGTVSVSVSLSLLACSAPSPDVEAPPGHIEPAPPVPPGVDPPVATTTASAAPIDDAPPSSSLPVDDVQRENQFSAAFFKKVSAGGSGNVFVSGASVRLALGMLYSGAASKTADEVAAAASFVGGVDKAGEAAKSEVAGWKALGSDKVELTIANKLFVEKSFSPEKGFVDAMSQSWGAGLEQLDFVKNADASRKTINAWAKKETKDRIVDLMPAGSIDTQTRVVVADAVYFNGKWTTAFEKKATAPGKWNNPLAEKPTTVPLMHRSGHYRYAEMTGFKIVELPYGKGDVAMVVLLPDDATALPKLEAKLDFAFLGAVKQKLADTKVDVTLPTFAMTYGGSEKETLKAMGMVAAFSDGADFTRISKKGDLKVTDVFHKTFIRVDESGTEAAAATAGVVGTKSVELAKPFVADHPFVFYLHDTKTGRVLFMGRVTAPAAP